MTKRMNISVPLELYMRMKKMKRNWSEVAAIAFKLELMGECAAERLFKENAVLRRKIILAQESLK